MPFNRPRTRNGDAAPAPPAQNAPRFFPPSHFAVAGNLRSPTRFEQSPSQPTHDIIPPSTLPHLPGSPSVSSVDAAGNSRLGQLTRKLSLTRGTPSGGVSPGSKPKWRASKNMEHWKGEMPELEANLLPSLRDTIDKMTNPNPIASVSPGPAEQQSMHAAPARYSKMPPQTPPRAPPAAKNEPRLPTPKSGRQPVLKSALKTPADVSAGTPTSRSPQKASRLGRSVGAGSRGLPTSAAESTRSDMLGSRFADHTRYRTDPGASIHSSPTKIPARLPKTPQPPPRPRQTQPSSHEPVKQALSGASYDWRSRFVVARDTAEPSSNSSDDDPYLFERPTQRPSPSPARARASHILHERNNRAPASPSPSKPKGPRPSVGLGIGVNVPQSDISRQDDPDLDSELDDYGLFRSAQKTVRARAPEEHHQSRPVWRDDSADAAEDSESAYDDSEPEPDRPMILSHLASSPSSYHDLSRASESAASSRSHTLSPPIDSSDRQRALSGIMEALERDVNSWQDLAKVARPRPSQDGTDYSGQTGLAIGDSQGSLGRRPHSEAESFSENGQDNGKHAENMPASYQPPSSLHHTRISSPSSISQRQSRSPTPSSRPPSPRRRTPDLPTRPSSRSASAQDRWPRPPIHPRNSGLFAKLEHSETWSFQERMRREEAASRAAFDIPMSPPPMLRPTESMSSVGSERWDEKEHAEGLSFSAESVFGQLNSVLNDEVETPAPQDWGRVGRDDGQHSTPKRKATRSSDILDHLRRAYEEEMLREPDDAARIPSAPPPRPPPPVPPPLPPRRSSSISRPRSNSRASSSSKPSRVTFSPQPIQYSPPTPQHSPPTPQRSPPTPQRSPRSARPNPVTPSNTSLADSSSSRSLDYDDGSRSLETSSTLTVQPEPQPWRATLSPAAYNSLREQYGATEMARQEALWALRTTEQAFAAGCQRAIRLFVQPLRVHESRVWLRGVPPGIARALDWFEDITHAHAQLAVAFRSGPGPVALRVAEQLRGAMLRLEVHQPYVVRVDEVVREIEAMCADGRSDFGEFVRLQERTEEAGDWSLVRFMREPVVRLRAYGACFQRLLELTPREHPDHLPTIALLHMTELMVRVMFEVKEREQEYDLVNSILSRVDGLSDTSNIASRERRLLARGRLQQLSASDSVSAPAADKQSRLFGALQHRSRRASSSSSAAPSLLSVDSQLTAASSAALATPATADDLYLPFRTSDDAYYARAQPDATAQATDVQALAFMDLLLLCVPAQPTDGQDAERWRLLDDIGLSRVLTASRTGSSLSLDLLPLTPADLTRNAPAPKRVLATSLGASPSAPHDFQALSSALESAAAHTRRTLARPPWLVELDGPRAEKHAVLAILESGLPLPKSPSAQLGDAARGRAGDEVQGEREERGWWSFRFRSVLREVLERGDAGVGESQLGGGEGEGKVPGPFVAVGPPEKELQSIVYEGEMMF